MMGDPYIICPLDSRTREAIVRRMIDIFDELAEREIQERDDDSLSPVSEQSNLAGDEILSPPSCGCFESDSE